MTIYTGITEGLIVGANAGSPVMLPFQDKIGNCTFTYNSEVQITETFGASGVKGASAACPFREEAMLMMSSQDITFSFLQAVFNTLAEAETSSIDWSETFVLSTTSGTEPNVVSTVTLANTPAVGAEILAADDEGIQYDVTASGAVVSFDDDYTGKKITVKYKFAQSTGDKVIAIGKGARLKNVGVYGRFFGCPDDLSIAIPNGIIESAVEMSVGENPASASLTVRALRDPFGVYAYVRKLG